MKNTFNVTVNMTSSEQLAAFIDAVGSMVDSITVVTSPAVKADAPENPAPMRRGRKGGSKVNETILALLQTGPAPVKELKEALEREGMSPGSLSTGLAALQKAGTVTRVSEGVYGLAA